MIKIGDDVGVAINFVYVNNRRIVLTKFDAADPRYGHGDHALIGRAAGECGNRRQFRCHAKREFGTLLRITMRKAADARGDAA